MATMTKHDSNKSNNVAQLRPMTRQEAAWKASQASANRSPEARSEAARKAARTRLEEIEASHRFGCIECPMTFQDAGRKGALIRWGHS
jgi:protein-arginine kinase activator protein McsA